MHDVHVPTGGSVSLGTSLVLGVTIAPSLASKVPPGTIGSAPGSCAMAHR